MARGHATVSAGGRSVRPRDSSARRAAVSPLRTAPSMVAGHPVSVHARPGTAWGRPWQGPAGAPRSRAPVETLRPLTGHEEPFDRSHRSVGKSSFQGRQELGAKLLHARSRTSRRTARARGTAPAGPTPASGRTPTARESRLRRRARPVTDGRRSRARSRSATSPAGRARPGRGRRRAAGRDAFVGNRQHDRVGLDGPLGRRRPRRRGAEPRGRPEAHVDAGRPPRRPGGRCSSDSGTRAMPMSAASARSSSPVRNTVAASARLASAARRLSAGSPNRSQSA